MTKKRHYQKQATGLKYDGINAPKVVAKGTGLLAEKIIDTAKQHDVHIHNDPILLKVLSHLELGDEIPQSLYLAVAKIIAFAYFLQGKHPSSQANKYPSDKNHSNRTEKLSIPQKINDLTKTQDS